MALDAWAVSARPAATLEADGPSRAALAEAGIATSETALAALRGPR